MPPKKAQEKKAAKRAARGNQTPGWGEEENKDDKVESTLEAGKPEGEFIEYVVHCRVDAQLGSQRPDLSRFHSIVGPRIPI